MKSRVSALLMVWALLAGIAVAKGSYRVAEKESKVGFSISHLTNTATGKFTKFSSQLNFQQAHPEKSTVSFAVEVASVDTGNSGRDSSLRGDEYFAAAKYPQMTFESKIFKKVGDNQFMVTGPLTIKGHTKNISVPVTLTKTGVTWATGEDVLTFKAAFVIDRTEFGVGEASSLLGSEVSIALNLEFRGAK